MPDIHLENVCKTYGSLLPCQEQFGERRGVSPTCFGPHTSGLRRDARQGKLSGTTEQHPALRRELHLLHGQFPATMVYVTHDSEEALALGERIAVLRDGVLLQVDSAEALLSTPRHRFVAEFFATEFGPMNFLEGRLVEEAGQPAVPGWSVAVDWIFA